MNKPKPAGNFNVGVMASLFDKSGKFIGSCFYAPNPVRSAIENNSKIAVIKAKFPMFAEEVTTVDYFLRTGKFNDAAIFGDGKYARR